MGEHERGESKWIGAFLLGFLAGVLLTLGGGGAVFMVAQTRGMRAAREAAMEAEVARAEAQRARDMAERARRLEAENLRLAAQAAKGARKPVDSKDEKVQAALLGVKTIDRAVMDYKAAKGEWPATLEVMTVAEAGKEAQLPKAFLLDPWGRAYVYEVANLNPLTRKPLIYSLGPDPKDEAGRVRNWK